MCVSHREHFANLELEGDGYGLKLLDLIQEGNIGLMIAVSIRPGKGLPPYYDRGNLVEITTHTVMEHQDLGDNQLAELPVSLPHYPHLETLRLGGNRLPNLRTDWRPLRHLRQPEPNPVLQSRPLDGPLQRRRF